MKELLIITGPQGSGNHLWSKVFAETPGVFGWSSLRDTYWIPHDKEPFAQAWHNPEQLGSIIFEEDYAVTSISCPYAYHGKTVVPDYKKFIDKAEQLGYKVKLAIIGRDQNILKHQQQRVRKMQSLPKFEEQLDYLMSKNPVFLSTELLYLYKHYYLENIKNNLSFPIYVTAKKLAEILKQDPNTKYFHPAAPQELDSYVRQVSGIK